MARPSASSQLPRRPAPACSAAAARRCAAAPTCGTVLPRARYSRTGTGRPCGSPRDACDPASGHCEDVAPSALSQSDLLYAAVRRRLRRDSCSTAGHKSTSCVAVRGPITTPHTSASPLLQVAHKQGEERRGEECSAILLLPSADPQQFLHTFHQCAHI